MAVEENITEGNKSVDITEIQSPKASDVLTGKDTPDGVWKYGGCHACMGSPCPIRAKVLNGKVVKVEGQMLPGMDGRICAKGHALIDQLYSPDRLRYPMRRI